MLSRYEKRILQVLEDHKDGLTTVKVAEESDISKTTALKYLASLRASEKIYFMEVGPAKLWRIKPPETLPKKRLPVKRAEALSSILNEFKEAVGLEGSAIVNGDGLTISADIPWEINPEEMGSLISQLLQIGMRSISLAKMDPLEGLILEGEKGRIVAQMGGRVLLIAFSSIDTPLGIVKLEIEEFVKKINEIIS